MQNLCVQKQWIFKNGCQRMNLDPYITPHTNFNSKEIEDFMHKPMNINLLEEKTERKTAHSTHLSSTSYYFCFLDMAFYAKRFFSEQRCDITLKSKTKMKTVLQFFKYTMPNPVSSQGR